MAYTLTLTSEERKVFDWVGNRYSAGEIASLLCGCLEEDDGWSQDGDITFDVPEHVAWEVQELAEKEDYTFPCFSDELRGKMTMFCMNIV